MACSRCGSDDHDLSGCKWPAKPFIGKFKFMGGSNLWHCGRGPDLTGVGYTAREAYQDWEALNKKDQTCEQSTE